MGFRYRNKKTGGEAEFTREQDIGDEWKLVEKGDGLPARAPDPGVLDAPAVLSEGRAHDGKAGYAAGAAVDVGTVESPGVDAAKPTKDEVKPKKKRKG